MDLIRIYQCLCDRTRLRILHLLLRGPLCVCHFQEILGEPQVKISKHLAYLKLHRLVEVTREANWRVYRLPARKSGALERNLRCLQDCVREDAGFQRDAAKLKKQRLKFAAQCPLTTPTTKAVACSC
jgi:ArsR family transcriptional regulator